MSDLLCSAKLGATTLALLLSAASLSAQASVTPDRTRLIFNESDKSISVTLRNNDPKLPYLAQSWIEDVPYSITCDTAVRDPLMEMTLSWSGTPSDFDNAAVSSNITGLGIQLKQAGQSFTINTPLVVNETDLPVLTAVPVKKSGVVLPEADFEAWATLQVDYQ